VNNNFERQVIELTRKLGTLDPKAYTREQDMALRLEALMVIQELHGRVAEFERHLASGVKLSAPAIAWLAGGERGTSSNTIFTRLVGFDALAGGSERHPRDPDDLRRCRLLLEQVPEVQGNFASMAEASPHWRALVGAWDEICGLMDEECPRWREAEGVASNTHDRMRSLYASVTQAAKL
jgi:hypothetical protein